MGLADINANVTKAQFVSVGCEVFIMLFLKISFF